MNYPHLIILYGNFSNSVHEKQDAMIRGDSTCGYRPMAERFGEIIYLAQQNCKESWESWINNPEKLYRYLKERPDSIVWSVKHCATGQKDAVLDRLRNKKVYYSCCSYHTINNHCDISLVDTKDRLNSNARLWVKGKDPEYWKPKGAKLVDYLFVGKRGDKNEAYFINKLTEEIKAERSILWVGGEKHRSKIKKSHHRIILTPFRGMNEVRDLIGTAKVGLILSDIKAEGFPQTFLEMTMCGVPVVYMGPQNDVYQKNTILTINDKKKAVAIAEELLNEEYLKLSECNPREYAINNYSLEKSYESILRGLDE